MYYGNTPGGNRRFRQLQPNGPAGVLGQALGTNKLLEALTNQQPGPSPAPPAPGRRAMGAPMTDPSSGMPISHPAPQYRPMTQPQQPAGLTPSMLTGQQPQAPRGLTPGMLGAPTQPVPPVATGMPVGGYGAGAGSGSAAGFNVQSTGGHDGGNGGHPRQDHLPDNPAAYQDWLAGGAFKDSRKARGPMWALLRQLIAEAQPGHEFEPGYRASLLGPSMDAFNQNETAAKAQLDRDLAQRGLDDSSVSQAGLDHINGAFAGARAQTAAQLGIFEEQHRQQAAMQALQLLTALRSGARGQAAQIAATARAQAMQEQAQQQGFFNSILSSLGGLGSILGGAGIFGGRGGGRPSYQAGGYGDPGVITDPWA